MCDSQRPTNGADSRNETEQAWDRIPRDVKDRLLAASDARATGIDRERILQRVNAYGAPSPCPHCGQMHVRRVPEWVRRAQENSLVTKDMTNGAGK
jgi:hypothetical protein